MDGHLLDAIVQELHTGQCIRDVGTYWEFWGDSVPAGVFSMGTALSGTAARPSRMGLVGPHGVAPRDTGIAKVYTGEGGAL